MIVEQRFERATGGFRLCEHRQSGLNVFNDRLPGLVASLIQRQMFNRTQGSTPTVCPSDDPSFVSRGLHTKNQTTNLGVPKLIGAIPGLCREDDALG